MVQHGLGHFEADAKPLQAGGDGAAQVVERPVRYSVSKLGFKRLADASHGLAEPAGTRVPVAAGRKQLFAPIFGEQFLDDRERHR